MDADAYKFQTYDEIPLDVKDYIMNISGVEDIREIELQEINDFFAGLNAFEKQMFEQFRDERKAEWDDGWVTDTEIAA